jgi:hypothetical protein
MPSCLRIALSVPVGISPPVIGDNSGELLLRMNPDLMASFALPLELTAECTELTGQLLVSHAGTSTDTWGGIGLGVS